MLIIFASGSLLQGQNSDKRAVRGCREGISAASDGPVLLSWTRDASAQDAVRQRAEKAAAAAAVSNAETSRALEYNMQTVASSEGEALTASVVVATAAGIAKVTLRVLMPHFMSPT
jgi:hypothetical protein